MKTKPSALVIVMAIVQVITLVFLVPSVVRANPDAPQVGAPSLVSYQGYLVDQNGTPLSVEPDALKVTIYSDATNGTALWTGTFEATQDEFEFNNGYFSVMLPIDYSFGDTTTWLQVTVVNGSTETHMPRQQIASVPYALQAQNAASAASAPWGGLSGVPSGFADGTDNDTNTTYTAGTGLALNGTQFSVTGAPWSGITNKPSGFSDNVDNTLVMLSDEIVLVNDTDGVLAGIYSYTLPNTVPSDVTGLVVHLVCSFSTQASGNYCLLQRTNDPNDWAETLVVSSWGQHDVGVIPVVGGKVHVRVRTDGGGTNTVLKIRVRGYVR